MLRSVLLCLAVTTVVVTSAPAPNDAAKPALPPVKTLKPVKILTFPPINPQNKKDSGVIAGKNPNKLPTGLTPDDGKQQNKALGKGEKEKDKKNPIIKPVPGLGVGEHSSVIEKLQRIIAKRAKKRVIRDLDPGFGGPIKGDDDDDDEDDNDDDSEEADDEKLRKKVKKEKEGEKDDDEDDDEDKDDTDDDDGQIDKDGDDDSNEDDDDDDDDDKKKRKKRSVRKATKKSKRSASKAEKKRSKRSAHSVANKKTKRSTNQKAKRKTKRSAHNKKMSKKML